MRMPTPGQMSIWWISKKGCRRTNTANSTDTIEEKRVNSLWFSVLPTTRMKIMPRNTHHDHFRRICVKISEISSTPGETQDGARNRRGLYEQLNLFFTFEKMAPTTCHFRLLLRRAKYSRHERVDTFDACGPIEVYVLQRTTCCLWKLRITLLQARANVRVSLRSVMLFNFAEREGQYVGRPRERTLRKFKGNPNNLTTFPILAQSAALHAPRNSRERLSSLSLATQLPNCLTLEL